VRGDHRWTRDDSHAGSNRRFAAGDGVLQDEACVGRNAEPTSRLEVLPGSSASLFFEDTEAVVDRLLAFVADPAGVVAGAPGAPRRARRARGSGSLTPRETDVLRQVAAGESNGQIAARLAISINTVERHITNIYRKIDARGRAEATAWAIRNGVA